MSTECFIFLFQLPATGCNGKRLPGHGQFAIFTSWQQPGADSSMNNNTHQFNKRAGE
ncbi:MAG: hypothetical protein IPQ25_10840 [Chitinophagaceae bacterium]|nr:hypothetical protein [Chitinophagaceae bacterium]MBL0306499.1 hypothetical protein [Chitinophagaceae bacterium]